MLTEKNHSLSRIKLGSLEAYLISQEEGIDEALNKLKDKDDPESIRRKLSILLDTGRYSEAGDLVKEKEPHKRWCDKAVSALVRNGDTAEAKRIIEWTKSLENVKFRDRSCLLYAEARYIRAWRNREMGEAIIPVSLTAKEKSELTDALETLQPLIKRATANERIENELESVALQIAMKIYYLFANYVEVKNLANLLLARKPIPLELAQFALSRLFDTPTNMPERLRDEHPDSFRVKVSAAMIEGEILGMRQDAFDSATKMANEAKSDEEKREICKVLYQLAQPLGVEKISKAEQIAISVLGKDDRFIKLLRADKLLRKEKHEEAESILQEIRNENDANWLQLYSQCLFQKGNVKSSVDNMLKASKILPHPEILKSTARLAFGYDRADIAAQTLEQALTLEPNDISILHNLAMVYTQLGDFGKAAEQFGQLRELEPEDPVNAINYANSLARSAKIKEAIKVYDSICTGDKPPLEALICRSQLLKSINKPQEAFKSLHSFKEIYWDEPDFVNVLLGLSYAAQQDSVAYEAFLQLQKLQKEGKAEPDVLFPVSLEQLKEHTRKWKEHAKLIHKNTVKGKCLWLMADELLGHTSYIGWTIRTQPLSWYADDPVTRAAYSVYSTNGFHPRKDKDGKVRLKQLQCPSKGTEIIIDLSSLITLHRLDLLDKAIDYFGKISIPSTYNERMLMESDKLVFPQLSYVNAAKNIKTALDMRRISVLENPGEPSKRPMPYVNEHTLPENEVEHYYRIKDLAETLYDAGKISDPQNHEIAKVAHKPRGAYGDHSSISLSQSILIDLSTLRTLNDVNVLEIVLDSFKVHIIPKDRETVISDIAQITNQEQIQRWHSEFWDKMKDDAVFHKVATSQGSQKDKKEHQDIPIAAAILAQQLKKPLFADDRVCQVLALNDSSEDNYAAAFGTDRFLIALSQVNMITTEEMANHMLMLMNWRYRFIVPSKEILKTLVERYKEHPPGQELRQVALYVHDCMRDPGLFSGFEKTDQLDTMASRLFTTMLTLVVESLVAIWQDDTFSDEAAKQITEWAIRELVPSHPKTLGMRGRSALEVIPKAILGQFLIQAPLIQNAQRANLAVRTVAVALDMEPDDEPTEYLKVMTETINGF